MKKLFRLIILFLVLLFMVALYAISTPEPTRDTDVVVVPTETEDSISTEPSDVTSNTSIRGNVYAAKKEGDNQRALLFYSNTDRMFFGGMYKGVVDGYGATYYIDGNKLYVTYDNNQKEEFTFEQDGDKIIVNNEEFTLANKDEWVQGGVL